MTSIEQQAADVIAGVQRSVQRDLSHGTPGDYARALAKENLLTPELPEPSEFHGDIKKWNYYPYVRKNGIDIEVGGSSEFIYRLSHAEARNLAHCLLAAVESEKS